MYKRLIEGKKAIFFDLDGTLVDNAHLWKAAYNRVLETERGAGLFTVDDYFEMGKSTKDQWLNLKAVLKIETPLQELMDKTYTNYLQLVKDSELAPREGFTRLMFDLKDKGLKMALVTGTKRDITSEVLAKIQVENIFDLVVCGDEVRREKPDPMIYKYAAKKLGVKPKEVLVFEDSMIGARSAAKAGMDLAILWDGEIPRYDYPGNVVLFLGDFVALGGNLDKDLYETLKDAAQ